VLRRAPDDGPGGPAVAFTADQLRITPQEALARARRVLRYRVAQGREDVRDFKQMRDEAFFVGSISDVLGSITHDVTPATLGITTTSTSWSTRPSPPEGGSTGRSAGGC